MILTYKDKIDNSIVIKSKEIKNEKMYIFTRKSRIISLSIFAVIAIFNIVSLIINPEKFSWAIAIVASIVSIISMLIIKLTSKSIFSLNHQSLCKVVDFINKLSKLILFINSINNFHGEISNEIEKITNGVANSFTDLVINNIDIMFDTIKLLIENKFFTFIMFAFSVILFIPVFFYFVIFNAKLVGTTILLFIPVVNLIFLIRWLLKSKGKFTEYAKIDGKYYKNTRKITVEHYRKEQFKLRVLLISCIFIVFTILFILSLIMLF